MAIVDTKKEAVKVAAPAAPAKVEAPKAAAPAKAEAPKAAAKKPAAKKAPAKKAAAKKPAAKKPAPKAAAKAAPKAAAKKPAAKKAAAKKPAAKKVTPAAKKVDVVLQNNQGGEWKLADIQKKVIKATGKVVKSLTIYVKPEEAMAYFTADGESGSVQL